MTYKSNPDLEFSRILDVDSLKAGETRRDTFTATPAECANLARRFNLSTIKSLVIPFTLHRDTSELEEVFITGEIKAKVVQTCVITLKDFTVSVKSRFAFTAAPEKMISQGRFRADEDDIPEPIVDGIIDLGEIMAQIFALEINPYPRLKGAEFPETQGEAEKDKIKPFSGLQDLLQMPHKSAKSVLPS